MDKQKKTDEIFSHIMNTWKAIQPFTKASYKERKGYKAFISGMKSPVGNYVQFNQPDIEIIAELKKSSTPFIALKGANFKEDFEAFAKKNNLIKENTYTAHTLNITGFIAPEKEKLTKGLSIIEVSSEKELLDADVVANKAFGAGEKTFASVMGDSYKSKNVHIYVAYINCEPVGFTLAVRDGDLVGLYWVGVVPEHQKKGVAKSIVSHAVLEAQKQGAKEVISQNNSFSAPIFQKLGFFPLLSEDLYMFITEDVK